MGKGQAKSGGGLATGLSVAAVLLRPQNRGWVTTTAVVVGCVVGLVVAWQRWGVPSLEGDDYVITADKISVTPQPAWIHTDVKGECMRAITGMHLGLLDREVGEKVASAFSLHPWVAKVVRVEKKYPAQMNVELEYRRPVLVVKLDVPGEEGLLFLDDEAVLLPSADFAPSQARNYLRIAAAGETPSNAYGVAWKSERIAGAAALAAVLENYWQPLGLYSIVTTRIGSGELVYELRSQDETMRMIWGRPPGQEAAGEASSQQKAAAMRNLGANNKSAEETVVDLRSFSAGKK